MPKPYTLTTPLPAGALRFHELSHSAGLSQLEETRLHLLSDKPDLAPDELLGQPMGLAVEMRDGVQRHIVFSILDTAEELECDEIVMPLPHTGLLSLLSRDIVTAVRRRQRGVQVTTVERNGIAADLQLRH